MRVFDTPPPSAKPFSKSLLQRLQVIFLPLSVVLSVAVWAIIGKISGLPAFILPSPGQVWQRFLISLQDGSLLNHAGYTLLEVILGLAIGTVLAAVTGYLLSRSPLVEALVGPYLIASQAIPIAAVAPLLIIWFGTGISTKILICALVVFFPVLVNTALGLRSVPEDMRTLMTTMRATPAQTLRHLEIPAAMPVFLGGLRVGATLSVIGAVVGELVGSDRGLGFLINVGRGQYDTALVFVALFALITMAIALYGAVILLEKRLLRWQTRPADIFNEVQ